MLKTVMIYYYLVSVKQVIVMYGMYVMYGIVMYGVWYSHFVKIMGILCFQCCSVTLQQYLLPHYFILKN